MRLVYQQVRVYTLCTDPSPTTGVCLALMVYREKSKSHPPTARGGVAKSNIQTGVGVVRLPSSLLPFLSAPFTPHWLIAIGVCPFSLVPDYLLYVLSVIVP